MPPSAWSGLQLGEEVSRGDLDAVLRRDLEQPAHLVMSERPRLTLLAHRGLGAPGSSGETELRPEPLGEVVNDVDLFIGHDPIISDRTNIASADLLNADRCGLRHHANMNAAATIRSARKAAGMSQTELALRIGVTQSVVSDWENGKLQSYGEHSAAIHRALKIPLDELAPVPPFSPVTGIQVVGEIQAGVWRVATEFVPEDRTVIPVVGVPGYGGVKLVALKVKGSSMDLLYPDGSFVIVVSASDTDARHGDRVVVYRAKGELQEASLKEVRVEDDGRVGLWPRSTSPEHQEPIYLDNDDQNGPEIAYVVVGRYSMEDRPPPPIQYRRRAS